MSIAAVPAYLGKNFSTASPGMRFGMYLSIWTNRLDQEREINQWAGGKSPQAREIRKIRDEQGMNAAIAHARGRRNFPRLWEKNDFSARKAWNDIIVLSREDQGMIAGFNQRQRQMASLVDDAALLALPAQSTAPFVTGMGNEHPLENGFAFLWPYGIPYLPGSGVKGVLRQAARELLSREWGESLWQNAPGGEVTIDKKKKALTAMDVLFGLESKDGGKEHFRGLLTFWDVIPEIHGNKLMVDIMTPHQTHYYQNDQPPHDSGQPNPISFLTVPPGSVFPFHITCDTARLHRIAPELLQEQDGLAMWKHLIQAAFEHAFEWLGFGAKTAVGYGVMDRDESYEKAAQERANAEHLARLSEEERLIDALLQQLAEDRAMNRKEPGGVLNEKRLALMDEAESWDDTELRKKAVYAIRETVRWLPWSKKRKKEMQARLQALEE